MSEDARRRVLAVASLARINLTEGLDAQEAEAALERFASQFAGIVGLMDTLAEVDTEGVEPMYWPLSVPPAPPREDLAVRLRSREEVLRGAPDQDGKFFVVPRIV